MTLPASFPLSMSQIATELGLPLPLSINHPWVILLSQKGALPISFSDLLGQTGHFSGLGTIQEADSFDYFVNISAPFFQSGISQIDESTANGLSVYTGGLGTFAAANPSKIVVTDTTTGQSAVLTRVPGTGTGTVALTWRANPGGIGIFGNAGQTHNFTIYPSN